MFVDRRDAGQALLKRLPELDPEKIVILALPRGGLPVAEVIADALGAPLDIVLVRKVGFPARPEFALAAVTDGDAPRITVNESAARVAGLDETEIRKLAERELPEIHRRRKLYLAGRRPLDIEGKTVVIVDDGVATGSTMRAAIRLVRGARPTRMIAAVPVGPRDVIAEIEADCDDVVCLECPESFRAVGQHYRDFRQVSDTTVTEILKRNGPRPSASLR